MPQLIPDPWFLTLAFSWLVLIFISPKKILSHINPNEPHYKFTKSVNPTWTWPW